MGCSSRDQPNIRYRKGLWSPEEDQKLRDYVLNHGHDCWSAVAAKAGLQRNGKSCRLRWINYLRPGLKRGLFSPEEEEIVLRLHALLGNKWSQIASHLPGRTDNEVKNHWNSYLKKKAGCTDGQRSASPDETNSRASRLESPEPMESSSGDFDERRNLEPEPLPKVLFAEWLPEEHTDDGNLEKSAAPGGTRRRCSPAPTVDDVLPAGGSDLVPGLSAGGGFFSQMGEASFFGELLPQFDPDGQFAACGLVDFLPMHEFYSNLH